MNRSPAALHLLRLGRAAALAVAGLSAGCEPTTEPGADAGVDAGPNRRICSVDDHSTPEKAVPITVGTRFQDDTFVCPPTDVDWFSFELPPNQPLVTIEIAYPMGSASRVELSYALFEAANTVNPVAVAADQVTTDNRSTVKSRHFVGGAGGRYYLAVRDAGDDDEDSLNEYGITVTTEADADPNEPNETCAAGKPIASTVTGAISFTGDKDAFVFDVAAGSKIIDARLTNVRASPVDLRVSLYRMDGLRLVDFEENPLGDRGATNVLLRTGEVSVGGSYCLVVEDDDGQEADTEMTYTLALQVVDETDPNEQTVRNDSPRDATDLGTGRSVTGDIHSKGDLDWYRIRASVNQIIEVTLDCPGCAGLQPSISLVIADPDGPTCSAGHGCEYLLSDRSCTLPTDCPSGICEGTDVRYCARACGERLDCPGLQCQMSAGNVAACAGAATCLPGATRACGVLQYTATAEPNETSVRTAQPALRGQTFLLVRDFQDDQFSPAPYTLNVRVVNDPDPNEPNNFYNPYTDIEAGQVLGRGRDQATEIAWTRVGDHMEATGRGCIAYQGDVDVYRIAGGNPCVALARTSSPARTLERANCGVQISYDRPGGPIDFIYFLSSSYFGGRASFRASDEGGESTFGDTTCGMSTDEECSFYYGTDDGDEDYHFVVRDYGQDTWDTDAARCYSFTLRSANREGCPAACPSVAPNQLCRCE